MTEITIKYPLTVQIRINEQLPATYSYLSTEYIPDPANNKAVINYKLKEESSQQSTFDQSFDQVLSGLTINASIDVYLNDDSGGNIKTIKNLKIVIN